MNDQRQEEKIHVISIFCNLLWRSDFWTIYFTIEANFLQDLLLPTLFIFEDFGISLFTNFLNNGDITTHLQSYLNVFLSPSTPTNDKKIVQTPFQILLST